MKRSILKQVILLAGLIPFTLGIKGQDLNTAITLTRSEQYDKAQAMLEQLIQKEPTNSKNYFYLGENYLLDYFADTISNSLTVATNAAREIYQKGVDANPNDPLNYIGLAKVAFYQGDEAKADELRAKAKSFLLPYKNLKRISPPAPEYAFTLAKLAESYIKNGEVDTSKALPLVREALKIDKKNKDIYLIAGDIYMLVNEGSKAIEQYKMAQFVDPKSPMAAMKIGYVYVRGKSLMAAIPNFEDAISLNPDFAPAYRELGSLYSSANRYEQAEQNFKKYLDLTAGNIPARIRYVNALFYAKKYDEVIKNVEEIFKVDKSRSYMNRIAGYSAFEKNPPDYNMALNYMETLFKTVAPERIIWKDHYYMARILLRRNQDYPKMVAELNSLEQQLEKEKTRLSSASTAADKAKYKTSVDGLQAQVDAQKDKISKADVEIDRGFSEYQQVLKMRPEEKALLNEMAAAYYTYRRFNQAAKTWAMLLEPGKENPDNLMQIGRAYYNGENYKSADSVFNVIVQKNPDYIPAYTWIARSYSRLDPDLKQGLAKPKFEQLLRVAQKDSVKYSSDMMEALTYLGYYHMSNKNYDQARAYYNRMINLDPNNKENKVRGLTSLANIETSLAGEEKTLEGKLSILARAGEIYQKILSMDPNNNAAKASLKWVQDYQASVKKGINPNEIKGVITDAATKQPVPYASIRVKNTAAEQLSNTKGEFKFEIPQGSEVLVISADGYRPKEVEITKSRIYNVALEK
jgi:tetratricopeptide (TPR) repeat protein